LLALHATEPEAARGRLAEMMTLRDRLISELRLVRDAEVRSGFRTSHQAKT
jgi:hypothetical protein